MLRALLLLLATAALLSGHAAAGTSSGNKPTPTCWPADRAALLGFKAGITMDTTGTLATWAGDDCCGGGWEGVACDAGTGRVVSLRLESQPGRHMAGAISPSVGGLEFLESLVIRDMGPIGGAVPDALSRLTRLQQLYLEGNALAGGVPGKVLSKMSSLRYLSLAGNRLEGPCRRSSGAFAVSSRSTSPGTASRGRSRRATGTCPAWRTST
uniref:Leucine-rich repeat-containing N-terminal plant-type domain-containing protein n=1 Tax=Triticum urartu TaxID=4572 RepID=A0A8R7TPA8_TRIUA